MSQIHQLYKLQQIDSEIAEKKKRLGEVLQLQKGNPALIAARTKQEKATAELLGLQTQHKDKSLELKSIQTKAKNSENRLYSGKVTNPKELSDLQSEIEGLGRRAEAVEEEVLELMIEVEVAEEEREGAETAVSKLETAWQQQSGDLETEKNELALRLHHLMQQRKEHLTTVQPNALREYDALYKKKGGVAVAKMRVNKCLSCQITASDQKVRQAKSGSLEHCGGCGRIIYVV